MTRGRPGRLAWGLLRAVGWTSAGVVIGAAVLLTVLRLALPLAAGYRAAIEDRVGAYLGRPVEIGAMEVEWRGLGPRLRLEDLRVQPSQGTIPLQFDTAFIDLALAPLSSDGMPLRIASVSLVGLRLEADVDRQGRISALGRELDAAGLLGPGGDEAEGGSGPSTAAAGMPGWLRGLRRVRLLDVAVTLGLPRGRSLRLPDIDVRLVNDDRRHRLDARIALPEGYGGGLRATLDVHRVAGGLKRWRGRAYLEARDAAIGPLAALWPDPPMVVDAGRTDTRLWAQWRAGRLVELLAETTTRGLSLRRQAERVRFERIGGRARWRAWEGQGWQLDTGSIEVHRGDRVWPISAFSVAAETAGTGRRHRFAGEFLRVEDVAALARVLPGTGAVRAELARLRPEGELHDVRALWSGPDRFELRARLGDVGWQPDGDVPGITGADGRLWASAGALRLTLETGDAVVRMPGLFRDPLPVERLRGRVEVHREDGAIRVSAPELYVSNRDLAAVADVGVTVRGPDAVQLDIGARLERGKAGATSRYLPAGVIDPEVVAWLDAALLRGRIETAELTLEGSAEGFPYRDGSGVFDVDARVRDLDLAFAPDWPPLEALTGRVHFHGAGLSIEARQARLLGVEIADIEARFADLEEGRLEVAARSPSSLGALVRVVNETPLSRHLGGFFRGASGSGRAPLDLRLTIPVDDIDAITVDGALALEDASLRQPRFDLDLTDATGRVHFSERGLEMEGVEARVRGRPLVLEAWVEDGAEPVTVIRGRGQLAVSDLVPALGPAVRRRVDGRAPWQLQVRIPTGDSPEPAMIAGVSSLEGTAIALPAPLGKPASARRRLAFSLPLTGARSGRLRLDYGERVRAVAALGDDPAAPTLERASVRFGGGGLRLPDDPGIYLAGRLDELDLSAWARVVAADAGSGPGGGPGFSGADLRIGRAHYRQYVLSDLQVRAEPDDDGWDLVLDSNEAAGRIRVPADTAGGARPVRARFELLDLGLLRSREEGGTDTAPLELARPGALPPLDIRIERLKTVEVELEQVALVTVPVHDGLKIHQVRFTNPHLRLRGQGRWRGGDRARTAVNLKLVADDLGKGLARLGYPDVFVEGEGEVTAELDWPGAPWDPGLERLEGHARIDLADGAIPKADPGPARLLGLLSLRALPQLVRFDFAGLVSEGFAFTEIKGRVDFADGNAYTGGLRVEGPAGNMRITGRTGLVARDYDQTIRFEPDLSGSFSLVGLLAGGPVGGAAVALIQRVLSKLGADVGGMIEMTFELTGSWDDPKVERVDEEPGSGRSGDGGRDRQYQRR